MKLSKLISMLQELVGDFDLEVVVYNPETRKEESIIGWDYTKLDRSEIALTSSEE